MDHGARRPYVLLLSPARLRHLDPRPGEFDLFDKIDQHGVNAVIACIIGAFVLANLLMTKPISQLFRPIFEPKLKWLFREAEEKKAAEQADKA